MKKNKILILLLLLILIGCGKNETQKENKKEENNEENITDVEKYISTTMEKMTLDEKIGQLIIISYTSPKMDEKLKKALNEVQPGGFILFNNNITTYEETLNFIKTIKKETKIPMFISIDEEGGNIQRLHNLKDKEITDIPYMYELGLKNDEELTYEVGKILAEELKVFGINMDFAPVIDVYSNKENKVIGKRSFGTTSTIVSTHGRKLADGLEDNGVIPVYKHFPGHGNTATDSHEALPIVTKTKEELLESDLIPFIDAINNDAKVIMIGHLAVPEITKDNTPASLSKVLITDFLKKELKYNGLVITDALNMKALTNYYNDDEICAKAVEAGVDILLMPSTSRTCVKSVKNALDKGTITEERINESVRKILKLKYETIKDTYNEYNDVNLLGSNEHQEIINKIK